MAQMHWQFTLRIALIAMAWFCVALAIYRLIPLPKTSIPAYWFGATILMSWIGVGLGAIFHRPLLGGVLGALFGLGVAVLSVQ